MKCFEEKMNYFQFLKYLVPSVLTMIFLSFYTTIDGFFVSRYSGSDALAGINIVIPVTCVIFGTAVMLATGGGSRYRFHFRTSLLHLWKRSGLRRAIISDKNRRNLSPFRLLLLRFS